MREIVVISGKGGAGKTSITGAFAHVAENAIICDLDVDAPDLHLLLDPRHKVEHEFHSGNEAVIDPEACIGCGQCAELCRFDAIAGPDCNHPGIAYRVLPFRCEGCKVCVELCPAKAIAFPQRHCGQWYVSDTRFGTMVHAQLFPGEENSGRLVTLLKREARTIAQSQGIDLVLSDGAPGIGCPVISSLAGTDLAVLVTEPTPSGIHDLMRVAELCDGFKVKVGVIINKWDINPGQADAIESYCTGKGYTVISRFPHDRAVTDAMVNRQVLTEYDHGHLADTLKAAWADTLALLDAGKGT
ncbi:MAG: ATP-binding protein [Pseudodesulfovibrio sp.]|uniref:Cobyrinic acid ac-diamide synthase n=1 Tax=Pseudodesulfovibrio aespoeensis (strain ATCC 700646 / DSM 10631 / Aspo-2) TaxID=643562 RepID=E6VQX6_PSEA9|nr:MULTISPECIES: ATP-binding protein [Pseudodesulfovibrio]MBU4191065.1 ATP-binding protein [Pseudomonadota bacterium]ADU62956.1 cobyrinic acid ac-diamide synthase [Pseudodesulfovibrio aespoeensis Aspo-2]MBU4244499.1 ATP-binding protein [Pseudomonadota bacterium]MBU4378396.1 ATP-binding protein [Pseudomonadota bacterium]MBU4474876.1 ATP-binding protein [Pseudomonadota bacterium]